LRTVIGWNTGDIFTGGSSLVYLFIFAPYVTIMQVTQENLRLQKIIAVISIVLFMVKTAAWYITHSVAILTDALESIVNVIAGLIGLYSLYVSAKPKDYDHPYGHGKAEFLSAAVEGTLITVAGFLIIYEAINNLLHPHLISKLDYGIILVAVTAFINYIAGYICIKTGKKNNSLALMASGKHLQSDTWSTAGIIAGLVLMLLFPKIIWIDSAVAILFAFIIIYTGYKIVRSSIAGIMDEADETLLKKMVEMLNTNRQPNWVDMHNLRIIKYGTTIHLDCHLTVPWYLNVNEAHKEIDSLSGLVKEEYGESVELFVHSDGCLDFGCPICIKQDCPVRRHTFEKRIQWTMANISSNIKHNISTE
jgi:cation diffusion facilitator family transporter